MNARVIDPAKDRHEEYFRQRAQIERELPAYSADAIAITYRLESPGLSIHLQLGPYQGAHFCQGYPALHTFYFEYNPKKLPLLSPARISLGLSPFTVGSREAILGQAHFAGIDGIWLDISFRRGPAESCRVLIHRDSGKAVFVGLESGPLHEALQGLAYELQDPRCGKSGPIGTWVKITNQLDVVDLNSAVLPPRNLLGPTTSERP